MRVLITGASGFVGRHLADRCRAEGATVVGLSRREPEEGARAALDEHVAADLTDAAATAAAVRAAAPQRVFHLAAAASVTASWSDPRGTLDNNLHGALGLLEAVRAEAPSARVLVASSGEVYGAVDADRLPVTEDHPLRPRNPYAHSKAAVDLLASMHAEVHGLDVVVARAFNHTGPGQSDAYVAGRFARRIAEAEAEGREELQLTTGDLRPRRDFTDVRDVVRAYWLALDRAPAGTYNVCSGAGTQVVDILAALVGQTSLRVEQQTDPALVREHEVMEIRGSNDKLQGATGWRPELALERTLRDTLDWWRERLGAPVPR
ncbi:MAG TPA: GDP-mannose 4,6-dehydratase [Thermoleophilaceae bacterium]|jgi:GDP-4-dehydro-6-deoxy-D-mannose reductase